MTKPIYVVLGAGMQGTCAAYDLLAHGAQEVRLVDTDLGRAKKSAERVIELTGGRAVALQGDASAPSTLANAIDGAQGFLSCVPYFLNPPLAKMCVAAGLNYVDLGGNTGVSAEVLALDEAARRANVALVPDCGLAPGLGNTLAADAIERAPGTRDIRIVCGGLPQVPTGAFQYHLVFSMAGLLNEYAGEADILRDGLLQKVNALDEVEAIDFPGLGALEAFVTTGGTSTAPASFANRLHSFEYKTLRYPGHVGMFRAYRDAGLLSEEPILVRGAHVRPRDVLAELLFPRLYQPESKDCIALMVTATGSGAGGRWVMLDRFDPKTGFSAMERCTAFPAATVLEMLVAGETERGALRLESGVPTKPFLERLGRRNLPLRWEAI